MNAHPIVRSLDELSDLVSKITQKTSVYGILGQNLDDSFYHLFFSAGLKHLGLNAVFIRFEIPKRELELFIQNYVHPKTRRVSWRLKGFAVTSPYRIPITRFVDNFQDQRLDIWSIGSVNTVQVLDSKLIGYNTEPVGFLSPLLTYGFDFDTTSFTIIGTGGTARSVAWALTNESMVQPESVTVLSSDTDEARRFQIKFCLEHWGKLSKFSGRTDILICTSTEGDLLDEKIFVKIKKFAYDVRPGPSKFLTKASLSSCQLVSGREMFRVSGFKQFEILVDDDPPKMEMIRAVADHFGQI